VTACPVCCSETVYFASNTILNSHAAEYRRCVRCGSVHVMNPVWLDEAYGEALAPTDLGLPSRCYRNAIITARLITICFRTSSRFLDYGGGNGLFVRLMRDRGYDFSHHDRHSTNRYAPGVEVADLGGERFDLVTAFEVLEHLKEPRRVIEKIFSMTDVLLASTMLLPEPPPHPHDWWYYAPETGQHIVFFSKEGLARMAAHVGARHIACGNLHLISRRPAPSLAVRFALQAPVELLDRLTRRKSLLEHDYARLTGHGFSRSNG
jgi:2-polyprenyl-3-methyl-5-hydroxy-6-metoxy-1,4-benzoquinol methylase